MTGVTSMRGSGKQIKGGIHNATRAKREIMTCGSENYSSPCSFGLSATSQQYFSLRTNQPVVLFSQNKSAPATSQTNRLHVLMI
jgi:hypothetical protein